MASALENYVNNVRTLSAPGNFRELAEHLNEIGAVELLSKNWSILDNVLETLDMQQHSLGVLYILIAKFNSASNSNTDSLHLIKLFKDFIHQCNGEQVRFAVSAYSDLCHMFTNYSVNQSNCIQGIKTLAVAIEKIRLFDTQLTAVHADLFMLSLKAKYFKIALKFLDLHVTSISIVIDSRGNSADAINDSKYFLLYFYYGGMIYSAVKNYDRALYCFEVCVSTPAMAMSHIMLESYKKFILVSLILNGKVSPIPKFSSAQVISRFMKPLAQVYHDLASAYATSSSNELKIIMNKYSETFTRDNNMGLVKQVAISLYKKNIQQLTKTFVTLSLSDVASRVQLPSAADAEKYILNMIQSGEIFATINQKDGMIAFSDNPDRYDSHHMFDKVRDDMTSFMDMIKQINEMEEEILLNPVFIKKTTSNQEDELSTQHAKPFTGVPTD